MKKHIKLLAFVLIVLLLLSGCGLVRQGESANAKETESANASQNGEQTEAVQKYPESDGKTVICLDAGHGFRDVGCDTDLLLGTESEVNLAVVMLVKEELEKRGAEVILTHDGESYPSIDRIKSLCKDAGIEYIEEKLIENDIFSAYERAVYASALAEKEGIDLFISLHVNSIEGHPEISQYEMDYYEENPYSQALSEFCESLSAKLDNETKISADEYENAFIVTKLGTHPSVLIEMGYATNEADAEKLNSESWRRSFASTLAECAFEWVASFETK